MKLPLNPIERESLYEDLIMRCLCSRNDRIAAYERWRYYYLFGTDGNFEPALFNKIYPAIDTLTSFLYAVDTTRFSIEIGASVDKSELDKVPPLAQRINDKWNDSNADLQVSEGVTWACVYGTTLIKTIQRGPDTMPFLLLPHCFGVLDEAQTMLDRQEAFVQTFTTTRPQLERELQAHPNREAILSRLSATSMKGDESMMAAGVQRIILNATNPLSGGGYTGNVNDVLGGTTLYRPVTQEEIIQFYELWVWNDDAADGAGDYQVVTLVDPQIVIYDRASGSNMFMQGTHPFTQICPNPSPDYFWGISEVQKLSTLQDLREHHLRQINTLIDRNVNPPKAMQGMWGAVEEKDAALQRLNVLLSSTDPGMAAKITEFKPQIPRDLWQIIVNIDDMFDETISLNNLSKGRGDTGVRSKGQTESLLRVGSSRPKKRALVIEDSLEHLAGLYLKLDQQHNAESLRTAAGMEFISKQFTDDYSVKVDAHSSSPIFIEEMREEAFELFDRGIIDGESVLDILKPQNIQILKEKYKAMAAAKAKQVAAEQAREDMMAQSKANPLKSVGGGAAA